MRSLNNMQQAVNQVNLETILQKSMEQNTETYLTQQKEQMSFAVNSKGETIGKYRSQAYAQKKNQMNPDAGFGNVDLKLTGSFYAGMEATAEASGMNIDSTDQKSKMLQQNYGASIFGLFGEWKEPFLQDLQISGIELLTNELNQ